VIATSPLRPAPGETLLSSVEAHGGNLVWGENQTYEGPFEHFVRDAKGTRRILRGILAQGVDLGARRGGGTQAVFTGFRVGVPGREELFTRDFRTGAIRSLPSLWRPRGLERSPSVWGGRFGFERELLRYDERVKAERRVRGRTLGLFATRPLRAVTRAKAVDTDLRGSRLAYVTLTAPPGRLRGTTTVNMVTLPSGRGAVRPCFVARATRRADGRGVALSSPVLAGSYVHWLRQDFSVDRASIRRRRLTGRGCRLGREERSREVSGMQSFATDRGRFFYTTQTQVREATEPRLTFSR